MSTRIGIRREGSVLSAVSRSEEDGRTYYDIAIRMTSFASRSQYGSTREQVRASARSGRRGSGCGRVRVYLSGVSEVSTRA